MIIDEKKKKKDEGKVESSYKPSEPAKVSSPSSAAAPAKASTPEIKRPLRYERRKTGTQRTTTTNNSWHDKNYTDVSYAEYKAFAIKNNAPKEILDRLEAETSMPGSQFYNPYKGGTSTQMQAAKDAFSQLTGRDDIVFNDQFFKDYSYLRNSLVRNENSGNLTTPNKKFTLEQTCAYWYEQALMDKEPTDAMNTQYSEFRSKMADGYNEFKAVYGREPTFEEFSAFADPAEYSYLEKILNVTYNSADPQKVSQFNTGTYFNKDTVAGLYYALQNGQDISADRDYTEDAVNFYLNPVQNAPSVKKYSWSGADLNSYTDEQCDDYEKGLALEGNMEELAAFKRARWVAKPHAESVDTSNILDEIYGYHHDEEWFDRTLSAFGEEYEMRLDENGKMSKPGSNATLMDRACYELYQEEQKRAVTAEAEAALKAIRGAIESYDPADYGVEDYDKYFAEVMAGLSFMDEYKALEKYINDPSDYCRNLFISEESISAMIGRHWKGMDISENIDYSATAADGYEWMFAEDEPSEPPLFYDEMQAQEAKDIQIQREGDKDITAQAVTDLSSSGANISEKSIDPKMIAPETYTKPEGLVGKIASVWCAWKAADYSEKLGSEYTFAQAVAADPVLKMITSMQLGQSDAPITDPTPVIVADIADIAHHSLLSDINNDDLTISAGIVQSALPAVGRLGTYLDDMIDRYGFDKANDILSGGFDVGVYSNAYQKGIDRGFDEETAMKGAFFKATAIAASSQAIKEEYSGDAEVEEAATELVEQIRLEEGMDDVIEILDTVNDEVAIATKPSLGEAAEAPVDMSTFNKAIVVGASSFADPGFAAQTNDLAHDIATGDVTPEHIVEGVQAFKNFEAQLDMSLEAQMERKTQMALQNNPPQMAASVPAADAVPTSEVKATFDPDENRTVYTRSGREFTAGEYTALMEEERRVMSGLVDYADMSDDLKQLVGYDTIMAQVESGAIDLPTAENYLHATIANFNTRTDDYLPSEMAHGATDVAAQLAHFSSNKTDEQRTKNVSDQERSLIREIIESDSYNFLPRIAAVAVGFKTSDTYRLTETLQANSKFFSTDELSSMLIAYSEGNATFAEIDSMIDARKEILPNEYVNALNHPAALQESYEAIDEHLASLQEIYKDNENMSKRNEAYAGLVELYKSLGEYGYVVGALSNEELKKLTNGNVDFDDEVFPEDMTALKAMDMLGGNHWSAPFTNDGKGFVDEVVFGGISQGIGLVLKALPGAKEYVHAVLGQTSEDEKSARASGRAMETITQIEGSEAESRDYIMSASEAFVQQGVSEFSRNLIVGAIGSALSGAVTAAGTSVRAKSTLGMFNDFAKVDRNIKFASTIAGRVPFAGTAFVNTANDYMVNGEPVLKSSIKAGIEAAIEIGTEALPLEKMMSVTANGISLSGHVSKFVDNTSPMALAWTAQTAQNVITEIGEEEISMILNRVVDMGDYIISDDKSVGEAYSEAFAGVGEDALATAQATAFTTLLFGVANLGGVTYQGLRMHMEMGTEYDADMLIRDLSVDLAMNLDDDADTESGVKTGTESDSETESDTITEEPMRSEIEDESAADEPVEIQEEKLSNKEDSEEPVAKPEDEDTAEKRYIDAAKVAMITSKPEDIDAAAAASEEYAKELEAKASEAIPAVESAEETAVPEESVTPEAKPVTAPPAASGDTQSNIEVPAIQEAEPTQEESISEAQPIESQPIQAPVLSSPQSQKVFDHLKAAKEKGIPEAIANAGAKKVAKQIVENDPGIASTKEAQKSAEAKVAEIDEEITANDSAIQQNEKKLEQAYIAMIDEGVSVDSSQGINTTSQITQANDALYKVRNDLEAKKKENVKQAKEYMEKAYKDAEKLSKETEADTKAKLIERLMNFAPEAEQEAEQYRNARRDKDGNLIVEELESADKHQENKLRQWDAGNAMAKRYAAGITGETSPSDPWPVNVEEYTDPANYPSDNSRYIPDWQETQKDAEEEREREEERNIRLTQDFLATESSRGFMLEVSEAMYENIYKNMRDALGYVDSDHISKRETIAQTPENEISFISVDSETGVVIPDETASAAMNAIFSEDNQTEFSGVNQPNADIEYRHVTENNRYLVLKKQKSETADTTDEEIYKEMYNYYIQKENGKTGKDKIKEKLNKSKAAMDAWKDHYQKAVEAKTSASAELEHFQHLPVKSEEYKTASEAYAKANEEAARCKRMLDMAVEERKRAIRDARKCKEVIDYFRAKRNGTETKQHEPTRYIILDKDQLKNVSLDSINKAALNYAVDKMANFYEMSKDQLRDYLAEKDMEYEDPQNKLYDTIKDINIVHYHLGTRDDLLTEVRHRFYTEKLQQLTKDALNSASTVIKGQKTLDKFIAENGGEAVDGNLESEAQFSTLIQHRKRNTKYRVSEYAIRMYGSEKDAKASRVNDTRSDDDFENELVRNINKYAQENNLTEDQRIAIIQNASTSKFRDRVPYYPVSTDSDGRFSLLARVKDRNDPDANTWVRDDTPGNEGNYSISLAWQRLEQKIRDMAWGAERNNVNTNRNSIEIVYVDSNGKSHKRKIGEYYKKSDEAEGVEDTNGYWFPSIEWIRNNASSVTCNFFCKNPHKNKILTPKEREATERSAIYIKLVPSVLAPADDKLHEADSSFEEDAYMRSRHDLLADYKEAANRFMLHQDNAFFKRAYLEACLNLNISRMRSISREYRSGNVTEARRNALVDEFATLERKYKITLDMLNGNENAFSAQKAKNAAGENAIRDIPVYGFKPDLGSHIDPELEKQLGKNFTPGRLLPPVVETRVSGGYDSAVNLDYNWKNPVPASHIVRQHDVLNPSESTTLGLIPTRNSQNVYNPYFDADTAQDALEIATEIYERLASDPEKYCLPSHEIERKVAAAIIEHCNKVISHSPSNIQPEARNNEPLPGSEHEISFIGESLRKRHDDQERQYLEHLKTSLEHGEYKKPEDYVMALKRLRDLANAGKDVAAIRTQFIDAYHKAILRDLPKSERTRYIAELAEEAKTAVDSYTIDPNADYESMLRKDIETVAYGGVASDDEKKMRGQLYNIKRRVGSYKSVKAIENASKRLDGMEKAGLDVSEMRTALEENRKALIEKSETIPQEPIKSFRGDYSFLSNFYDAPVEYEGVTYKNSEAAFQAAKTTDPEKRKAFASYSGAEAKRAGRRLSLRSDWDSVRLSVMENIIRNKFTQNPELTQKLLSTGNTELIEGNAWNDRFWGVDERSGVGENNLGRILMNVRNEIYSNEDQKNAVIENAEPRASVALGQLTSENPINLELFGDDPDFDGIPQYEDYLDHGAVDEVAESASPSKEIKPYKTPAKPINYNPKTPGNNPVVITGEADIDPVTGVGHAPIDRRSYYGKKLLNGINQDKIEIVKSSDKSENITTTSVIEEVRNLQEVRDEVKKLNKNIDDITTQINTVEMTESEKKKLEEEKAELIKKRNEFKRYREELKTSLNSSDIKSAALESATSRDASVFSSEYRTETATNAANRMVENLEYEEGENTVLTDEQAANILGKAFSEKGLAENKTIAGSISGDARHYNITALETRMRIECAKAVLDGEYSEGVNKAIPKNKNFQSVLGSYLAAKLEEAKATKRPETEIEELEATVNNDVMNDVADWLEEFNVFPEMDTAGLKARIIDMQNAAEKYETMARNAKSASKSMFAMAADGFKEIFETRKGGRLPIQIMDALSVILSRVDKDKNVKKALMDFGLRNFLNPYQAVQTYTGKHSPLIAKIFIDPVIKNNADMQNRSNDLIERIKTTKITHVNSSDFHRWAEGYLSKDKITEDQWSERGYLTYEQYNQRHGGDYASESEMIADLQVFRVIYEELIADANAALEANGLDTIGYIEDYLPHTIDKGDAFSAFMSNIFDAELPADIAGKTEDFKPMHQWNPHEMHRSGSDTKFDMLGNFSSYITPTLNAIYHTGDIVRLRQLEAALSHMDIVNEETGHKEGKLQTFSKWVTQYTNQLAGKKTVFDHAVDNMATRGLFFLANTMKQVRADALISGNSKVALSNLLPLVQVAALDSKNTARAICAVVASGSQDNDGMFSLADAISRSAFLTSRNGEKMPALTAYRSIVDKGYIPMEYIDEFASKVVWTTCYLNSRQRPGSTTESSIIRADRMALEIMSSKVTGEAGIAYKSAILGSVFQFTAEGINLMNYMVNTMPKYSGGNPSKILKNIILSMLGYWIYNEMFSAQSASDVIGTVYHGIKDGDSAWQIAKDTVKELNPADRFTDSGLGGVPAISAFTEMWDAISYTIENGLDETAGGELASAFLGFVPMGTQIKRSIQGISALAKGYNKYKGAVQHPVERNAWNVVTAPILGPQSTIEGHASSWGNMQRLEGTQEEQMLELMDKHGLSATDAYNTIAKASEAASEKSEASSGAKIGADTAEHEQAAQAARSEMAMPPEMSSLPGDYIQSPEVQKGIEIWRESGEKVYPKASISLNSAEYEDEEYQGILRSGILHDVSEEELAYLNEWYRREYKRLIRTYNPETTSASKLASQLSKLESNIKTQFIKDRIGGN